MRHVDLALEYLAVFRAATEPNFSEGFLADVCRGRIVLMGPGNRNLWLWLECCETHFTV